MEHQEPDYLTHRLTGNVLPRRTALKRLAGGHRERAHFVGLCAGPQSTDSCCDIYPQPSMDAHSSAYW